MIRPAQTTDCTVLATIDAQSNTSPWSAAQFQTALDSRLNSVVLFEQDNTIQGFAVWQTVYDESELHLIATAPAARRQGIGSQLMTAWFQTAASQQVARLFLEVRQNNQAAIALYHRLGFVQNGWRKDYYPNPDGSREHAILMEKTC